jgi:uncharacterized protein YdhG (YjbR/CyaY superfamily)
VTTSPSGSELIDAYLAPLPEAQHEALSRLRRQILSCVPDAEQVISYAMPGFKVRGKVVAGFAAFKHHLAYLPHSGSVLAALGDRLDGYERTKSSLHFTPDHPLSDELVRTLISTRLQQIP